MSVELKINRSPAGIPGRLVYDSVDNYTPEQFELFFEHLARTGRPLFSAEAAKVSYSMIKLMASRNPKFAERMAACRMKFIELLEEEATRRAVEGDEVLVVQKGEVVFFNGQPVVEKRKSDRLLEFLLKGAAPEKYRDGMNVNVTTTGGVMIAPADTTPETWINKENDRLAKLEKQEEEALVELGLTPDGEYVAEDRQGEEVKG